MSKEPSVVIKTGDVVTWGQKYDSATKSYVPAHRGEVKSFENGNKMAVPTSEGARYANVEVRREHKKTGKFLGTQQYRPYVSQLTIEPPK